MNPQKFGIYLASNSPRRHELLLQAGIAHEVLRLPQIPGQPDEPQLPGEFAINYVARTTRDKIALAQKYITENSLPVKPILCADTTVILDGKVLDKAHTEDDVRQCLQALSGQKHEVHTCIALACNNQLHEARSVSTVQFRELNDEDIDLYVISGEGIGKAGGYGIQGLAGIYVQEIQGSYSGIMGLPLCETWMLLRNILR